MIAHFERGKQNNNHVWKTIEWNNFIKRVLFPGLAQKSFGQVGRWILITIFVRPHRGRIHLEFISTSLHPVRPRRRVLGSRFWWLDRFHPKGDEYSNRIRLPSRRVWRTARFSACWGIFVYWLKQPQILSGKVRIFAGIPEKSTFPDWLASMSSKISSTICLAFALSL